MTATFPAVLIETGTFTKHDGIWISYVGEDGDIVALGHYDLDRAHAAFVKADEWYGVDIDDITTTWAVLTDPPDHDCVATPTVGCAGCDDTADVPWWIQWGVDKDTPGAFPVMVVEA